MATKRSYDDMQYDRRETGKANNHFHIRPLSRFQQNFPYFRKPQEVGYFSHDEDRCVQQTKEQLKYYAPPPNPQKVHFDLTKGYDTFIKKDDTVKEYLDDLLKWVVANESVFNVHGQKKTADLSTDFICWRGLLTRLLCTPYENREGWLISVIKYNNTFYLCEFETEDRLQQRQSMDEKGKLFTYGGWKFEQYLVKDSLDAKPDTSEPVNNKTGFCSVVRGRLAEHSMVYGGEVDCTDVPDGQQKVSEHYVELKTNFEFKHAGQERNFKRFKLIKFWAQSFLLGIPRIVVGFKDDRSIVRRLEEIQTHKIPSMVKDLQNPWEATVCFNFLNQFLHHVKRTVAVDDPRSCYVFRCKPGEEVSCSFYPHPSDFSFLPDWYIEHRQKDT